jgi:hypothetical protein
MRPVLFSLLACLLLIPSLASGAEADPLLGTWVMDPAKSTFKPGPGFKSQTRVFTSLPDGTQMTVTGVAGDGTPVKGGGTYRLDGRDYPLKGIPGFDSVTMMRMGALKLSGVAKAKGQQMGRFTFTVSEDKRTMTLYFKGLDANEQPFENTLVFSRK